MNILCFRVEFLKCIKLFYVCVKCITFLVFKFNFRGALDGLYAEFVKLSTDEFIKGEYKRRIVVTTIWFFSSVLLAVLTPNIGVVIELLGCLASVNIFIFPGKYAFES